MGKRDHQCQNPNEKDQRVQAVLDILRKQAPLTLKQEKFCNKGCVERFLKAKGDSVKKAAKHLRSCLVWRESLGIDRLMADEFSAELAEGVAYVAGHDESSRPVMIFRIKQDYQKFHSQKMFTVLLAFTVEVAIQTMAKNVEQFVILFDASFFRSASAFMNILLAAMKVVADYYPGRLHKAFVIDPPSLFSYLWKGVKAFVELAPLTMVVSSLDFEDSLEFNNFSTYPRAASLRFSPASVASSTAKIGPCSSSRFSFTVSHHFDSLKPWHLTLTDTSASKIGPTTVHSSTNLGSAAISPLNARSTSFASPLARTPRGTAGATARKGFFPSTPLPQKTQEFDSAALHPRAARPSFFQSPAMFFKKDCHVTRPDKSRESFAPFLKFYRRPYDEMIYRSKMRPPLGGLIAIVPPHLKRRHMSVSQRF
nr:phosphatidylinositol/phosphatidylcholine transfer protein SFH4 [Ipomoea batatas]